MTLEVFPNNEMAFSKMHDLAQRLQHRMRKRLRSASRVVFPVKTTTVNKMTNRSAVDACCLIEEHVELISECKCATPPVQRHSYSAKEAFLFRNVLSMPDLGIASDKSQKVISETVSSDYRLRQLIHVDALRGYRTIREDRACTSIECGWPYANYYHWLVDSLPRAWALQRIPKEWGDPVILFVNDFWTNGMLALLQHLVPKHVVIERMAPKTRLSASRYIHVPCLAEDYCGFLPTTFIQDFREAVEVCFGVRCNKTPEKRILISRGFATKRQLLNENQLALALSPFGFTRHVLEHMSIKDQAQLFSDASIVVAPHGAGLTNILFAKGCRVLEMFPGRPFAHYRWLANSIGHEYIDICGDSGGKHDSFTVACERVVQQLKSVNWL